MTHSHLINMSYELNLERKMKMSLNVLVKKLIVPPDEVLRSNDLLDEWCERIDCEVHEICMKKEIEKLSKTPWLFDYVNDNFIDWEIAAKDFGGLEKI